MGAFYRINIVTLWLGLHTTFWQNYIKNKNYPPYYFLTLKWHIIILSIHYTKSDHMTIRKKFVLGII
jgi:hypothetical protein